MTAPCLRSDLSFIEQRYRGETSYVVKDLAEQRYFRFGATEVRVMRAFDGNRTPHQVAQMLVEQGTRVSARAIEQFARTLANAGFFERTMAEKTTLQLERLRSERRVRRRVFRGELLRMRWSFGDPDVWLARTMPLVRWMFTPAFVAASVVLFAIYLIVLGQAWPQYVAALRSAFAPDAITFGSVAVLAITGLVVVLIHELGHAYSCKYFGGEVRELGFMLLYFQPAFYCNVSDAWSFPQLRARLWVTAAGAWIQLVVAAVAAIVWWVAEPGTLIAEVCAAAMLVGGVMTLLTNMNPLLPLDGYFALTDWLDIPNLRRRALSHVGWWIQRHVFRLELSEPVATLRERRVFFIYGMLSGAYITLTLALFAWFALGWATRAFGVLGALAVVAALAVASRESLSVWVRRILMAVQSHRANRRRRIPRWALVAMLGVLVIVGSVAPWTLTSSGTFIVEPATVDSVDVRIALTNDGAARVRAGQVVHLLSYADVWTPWTGQVGGVSTGQGESPTGLEARVRVARGDAWRPGIRGEASVELERATVLRALMSTLRQGLRIDLWL